MAALPSETPDNTHMVNGTVRTITKVGGNLWLGGDFTKVKKRDGSVVATVSNVAVFDAATGAYKPGIAPELGAGSETSKVTEIKTYGTSVLIGGTFAGPSATQRNLAAFDATTGELVRWFDSGTLESLLAAPDLGRVYAGGGSLTAFEFATAKRLWTRAKTSVDNTLRAHPTSAAYRDLERDGSTIWAACGCDAVDGAPAKALVKLNTEGAHDAYWVAQAKEAAFGSSLAQVGGDVYLAAGGNDFLAKYPKASGGARTWMRDTAGAAQVVEVVDGELVVGGHFWEVADQGGDRCGHRSRNNAKTLDSNDECRTRKGLAAYSFGGTLQPWNPTLAGEFNLAWALYPEATPTGTRLHVGGEFLTVSGVRQTYYARLS
jgi:hypothetical protein